VLAEARRRCERGQRAAVDAPQPAAGEQGVAGERLLTREHRRDAGVLVLEQLPPVRQGPAREDAGEPSRELLLPLTVAVQGGKLRRPEQLAEAPEETLLERRDGERPAIRGRVAAVAGEAAAQRGGALAREPRS
jgi:hypothetical protein